MKVTTMGAQLYQDLASSSSFGGPPIAGPSNASQW
jgi:hypothetical protein